MNFVRENFVGVLLVMTALLLQSGCATSPPIVEMPNYGEQAQVYYDGEDYIKALTYIEKEINLLPEHAASYYLRLRIKTALAVKYLKSIAVPSKELTKIKEYRIKRKKLFLTCF